MTKSSVRNTILVRAPTDELLISLREVMVPVARLGPGNIQPASKHSSQRAQESAEEAKEVKIRAQRLLVIYLSARRGIYREQPDKPTTQR